MSRSFPVAAIRVVKAAKERVCAAEWALREVTRRPDTGSGARHQTTPNCRPARSSGWPSGGTPRTPGCCGLCSRTRRPGARARAVAEIRALDCAHAKQLRPLLDDPAAGVVRETATNLLPSAKELSADWLLVRTNAERPRPVRVAAFRLLDARRHRGATGGGRSVRGPGYEAAHLGRAISAALASVAGWAARRRGGR